MKVYSKAALALLVACTGQPDEGDEEATGETEQAVSAQTGMVAGAVESEPAALGGFDIDGIEPVSLTVFHLHLTAQAKWDATVMTSLSWDGDKVRQGQTLNVGREATALGNLKVLWTLTGTLRPLNLFDVDIGSIPLAADLVGCSPRFDDGDFECTASSPTIPIVPGIAPLAPYVDFGIDIKFKITPQAGGAARTLMLGDEQGAQADLALTAGSENDALAMPCGKPVGTTVDYVLDPFTWSPSSVVAQQQPKFEIGTMVPNPLFPLILHKVAIVNAPFGPIAESNPSFTLEGAGSLQSLGELQPNNVLPTIAALGPFSGQEGSAVPFSQATTSACPITSYVWQFSNGTTSYGPNPQRTFGDDGQFDGQLTVTDSTNLSATGSFAVSIANRAPNAEAGPSTSGVWGQPIALAGQAVDPGTDDQATLVYTWDFGDGTPGAGGATTAHAYAAPGDYVATLTVCDDHVCDTDTTLVHVRKRTTSVAYTGANLATYSAQATLAGSIVDELGQPVVGGSLAFQLGANAAGSAQTNAAGNASRSIDVLLPMGGYPITVTYAGNGFYDGGFAVEVFEVAQMATSLAYTGSKTGGANKTINLSAKLADALDRPLANKSVVFVLGTQTVTATTSSTGVATAPLKLDQKNGHYPLTATFTPSGADATQWNATTVATTFTIGNK